MRSCSATSLSAHIIAASAALHVIGAAADQPVALDARLELLGAARDDVEMAVPDDAGGVVAPRADLGDEHGQAVVVVI